MGDFDLAEEVKSAYLRQFTLKYDADVFWSIFPGVLVFFMHAGFAMLEAGSISDRHKVNVLFKNVVTVLIGGISFYMLGFGFAYGGGQNNSFLGSDLFFGTRFAQDRKTGASDRSDFFFQFGFCITTASIVSGAIVGRMRLEAYMFLTFVMTGFIYPAVAHWAWSETGFLSAFKGSDEADLRKYLFSDVYPNACGVIDFAGGGVVHVTGGSAALISAIIVGPRSGRFQKDGSITPMPGHNLSIATLGTLLLWFGWFGFNAGSALEFNGLVASKVIVATSLGPATAFITHLFVQKYRTGKFDLPGAINAILSGLVSITAGCATISDFAAIPIGFVAALVYIFFSEFLLRHQVDDPINASSIHFFCGIWGVLATGIFSIPEAHSKAYECPVPLESSPNADWLEPPPGHQMLQQIILLLVIILWVGAIVTPILFLFKRYDLLRVSISQEEIGLDTTEHNVLNYEESEIHAFIKEEVKSKASAEEIRFIPNI